MAEPGLFRVKRQCKGCDCKFFVCASRACPLLSGMLIWRYGTTVAARATYSGVKHELSGARAW